MRFYTLVYCLSILLLPRVSSGEDASEFPVKPNSKSLAKNAPWDGYGLLRGGRVTVVEQALHRHLNDDTSPRLPLIEICAQIFVLGLLEAYLSFGRVSNDINGNGPYAVMMPWDAAFEKLPLTLIQKLQTRPWNAHLQNLLQYHIYDHDLALDDLADEQDIVMVNGETARVTRIAGTSRVRVNGMLVIGQYQATNGYAYMLDTVLMPAWIDQTLWNVISGETDFSAFKTLWVKAGLESELQRDTDAAANGWTILVPDNAAITMHLDGDVYGSFMTNNDVTTLQEALRYHIIPNGPLPSMHFMSGTLRSLQGETIQLSISGNVVTLEGIVNHATIISNDHLANNGMLHGIDRFLLLQGSSAVISDPTIPSTVEAALESCPAGHADCRQWLTAHNTRRLAFFQEFDKSPVTLLEWDVELEAHAQDWMDELQSRQSDGCAYAHEFPSPYGEGENLFGVWGKQGGFAPEEVLYYWWDEEREKIEAGVRVLKEIGHFTQAAWYGTTKVGCASYSNPDSSYGICQVGICRYWKAGNCNFEMNDNWLDQVLEGTTVCNP